MGKRICSIEGCGRPHKVRGWCNTHYERWRRLGHVKADMAVIERINVGNECSADNCEQPAYARGRCPMHWRFSWCAGHCQPFGNYCQTLSRRFGTHGQRPLQRPLRATLAR